MKAHQRIIREQKEQEYLQDSFKLWEMFDISLKNATVKEVTRAIAEKIILEYEWLGTLPAAQKYYGLFFGNLCGGVCCFTLTCGVSPSASKMFGLEINECACLIRGACAHWTPKNSASFLITKSVKMLPKKNKVVIAYSDTDAGEIGTVYQSCNWICLGRSKSNLNELVSPKGDIRDQMFIWDMSVANHISYSEMKKWFVDNGWLIRKKNPKIRYCFIRPYAKKDILPKLNDIKPYPKRHE